MLDSTVLLHDNIFGSNYVLFRSVTMSRSLCKYGNNCVYYQQGTCWYHHLSPNPEPLRRDSYQDALSPYRNNIIMSPYQNNIFRSYHVASSYRNPFIPSSVVHSTPQRQHHQRHNHHHHRQQHRRQVRRPNPQQSTSSTSNNKRQNQSPADNQRKMARTEQTANQSNQLMRIDAFNCPISMEVSISI